MTALEAKKIADESKNAVKDDDYTFIQKGIKRNAEEGCYNVAIYFRISATTVVMLLNDGYTISPTMMGHSIVSWK